MAKKIGQFLSRVLNASPRNPRWSWGAIDEQDRLFLLVFDHNISRDGKRIAICWPEPWNRSPGFPERQNHTELLRNGSVEGYGVRCTARGHEAADQSVIDTFDDLTLLRLGTLTESRGITYAEIVDDDVPVNELRPGLNTLRTIVRDVRQPTVQQALVDARVGQGWFRSTVLRAWENRCGVTGSRVLSAIRASHLKSWSKSSDAERLDPNNGIPLIANLDVLFDRGLITFESSGKMLISDRLDADERRIFNLQFAKNLQRSPGTEMCKYLAWHRRNTFR